LANTKSAIKRIRSSAKRQVRNRHARTETRTFIKNARAKIGDGELDAAKESVAVAVRALDKAAEKGIIHKNNAARRKSRLLRGLAEASKTEKA
jgi:small subunit ribosomal protein S20